MGSLWLGWGFLPESERTEESLCSLAGGGVERINCKLEGNTILHFAKLIVIKHLLRFVHSVEVVEVVGEATMHDTLGWITDKTAFVRFLLLVGG